MGSKLPDSFTIIDSTQNMFSKDILIPFAVDEIICREVGERRRAPVVHLWRHEKAFVLGLRDRKLPNSLQAMDWLTEQGYRVAVRNSGGAAVPLDQGVLNLSIILPNHSQRMDFHQDFELMYEVIGNSLKSFGRVEKGEIQGAYCPGDFDLSVGGRKFCGIAQRRQTKAFVIQAFLVVEGSGEDRAKLVSDFYQRAAGAELGMNHPQVTTGTTVSLQEVFRTLSLEGYRKRLLELLLCSGGVAVDHSQVLPPLAEKVEEMAQLLRQRYEKRSPA